MSILHLSAGGRSLPVTVEKAGRKLALSFRYFRPLLEEVKVLKGAEWDKDRRCWLVTDCRRNRIQLALLQNQEPPELKRYNTSGDVHISRRLGLYQHQVAMFNHAFSRRGCILAAEMGTGKTLAVFEAMEAAAANGFTDWWYVSMLKPLKATELEVEKWGLTVKPRFVNYEMLRKVLVKHRGAAPHGVVFDESSRLKNAGAAWTKAAQHLADAVRDEHDGYVILMTGSPAPKDPCDWWSQAEIACPGFLRESTAAHLRRRLAVIEMVEREGMQAFPKLVSWKMDEVELLKRRLDGLVMVVLSKDCQDLPEIRYERIKLQPTTETLRAARLVANTSLNAISALNKCRQLSDGFQYQDDGPTLRCESPKDAALQELLGRYEETGRIIVYASYKESVDRCVDLCTGEGWNVLRCDGRGWATITDTGEVLKDKTLVTDWLKELDRVANPGTLSKLAFVAHPKSGGFGMTLTAAPAAIFYSNDFDWESRIQGEKRAHREGMDTVRGFTIWDICHLPTDEYVLENHAKKKTLQSATLEDVRRVLGATT